MKQLRFGHYLMVNDAELCELGSEMMVMLLGFFAGLDGSKGVLGDLWGYYGDWCPIKPQMDDGRVLQTQICRPCFSLCFQCSEDFDITRLSIRVRLPLVLLPQINSPWNVNISLHSYPELLLGFFHSTSLVGAQKWQHWLKICQTFLTLLLFCFLVQKSEAGYRDASSIF